MLLLLPAFSFWISGCRGDGISLSRVKPSAVNTDVVYQQIRSMNPADLDRCRIAAEPSGSGSSTTFSGGISNNASNPSGNSQAAAGDAAAWANAQSQAAEDVGGKLFGGGDGGGATTSPAPTTNRPSFDDNTSTQPAIQIRNARILSRDNINYAQINVDPNTLNTATMYTKGYVNIDMQVTTGRRVENITEENVLVDLVYSLSNSVRGWQCDQVYIDTRDLFESPTFRERNPGGRIGW